MSIIANPEPTPTRVFGVLRTLQECGPITKGTLNELMHPQSVWSGKEIENDESNKMVQLNLKVCEELNLVETSGSGRDPEYSLSKKVAKDALASFDNFITWIGPILLNPVGKDDHYYRFARILAWYLDQAVSQVPSEHRDFEARHKEFLEGDTPSDVLYRQTLLWGSTVEVLIPLQVENQDVHIADPTRLLRRHITSLFKTGDALGADKWIGKLGSRFPIFETGHIRKTIASPKDSILSESLSLALESLAEDGDLRLEHRADAPSKVTLRIGSRQRPVSHITVGGRVSK